MKRRRGGTDSEASLSFLDVIACAFGAIVLLVLVLPVGETGDTEPGVELSDYGALLFELAERQEAAAALEAELTADQQRAASLEAMLSDRKNANNALRDLLAQTQASAQAVRTRIAAAEQAQAAVAEAAQRQANESKPTDYAGIPVDSEYVAIVMDTSGSMRQIWGQVVREVESVLAIYPEIRGFQVISASGDYLWQPGKWIEDGPGNRGVAKARLRGWSSASVSNPERGILTAVRPSRPEPQPVRHPDARTHGPARRRVPRAAPLTRRVAGSRRKSAVVFLASGVRTAHSSRQVHQPRTALAGFPLNTRAFTKVRGSSP